MSATRVPDTHKGRMTKRTWAKIAFSAVVLLLIAFAVDILLLVFASILLAILLRALAQPLAARLRISPRWALAIVVALLALAFSIIGWSIAPAIGEQVRELKSALPAALQRLQQELSRFVWLEVFFDSAQGGAAAPPQVASKVTGAVSGTLSALGNTVVAIVIALYLAANPRPYVEGTVRLFPLAHRDRAREVLLAMGNTLRWWLLGKAISMAVVGAAVFIGLVALGVKMAAALALLAALLDFIPNIGPLLALIPAALFALLQGPAQVLYVALLYGAIQVVEAYVLTPLIERRTVELPPALTLVALLVGALLFGWLGLLLAAPATAALLVMVQMVYVEDTLGEQNAR
ncbi:MAG TPA: AI-2E family transporter [Burkholderiaceae bacterium]|nr:AI-2E family transporter [Burkholderiaceae bacterium]